MTDAETTGEPTLDMMMEAANALKGSYFAEISLGYHPGVTNGKHWLCSVEADIRGAMFGLWASTPQEAVRHTSAEAIRRVPVVANADLPVISEWYSRDAWVLSSSILAGNGSEVDVADIIGATRRSSIESVFISRSELGWALSRLVVGGLLSITDGGFTPSARALELWVAGCQRLAVIIGERMHATPPRRDADRRTCH